MYTIFPYNLVYKKRIYLPNSVLNMLISYSKTHYPSFWTLFMESAVKAMKSNKHEEVFRTHTYTHITVPTPQASFC